LSEHKLVAACDHRHIAYAERQQFFAPGRIVQYVDRDEVDILFRKKLFRSEAATSSGLGEEYEFIGDGVHANTLGEGALKSGEAYYLPRRRVKRMSCGSKREIAAVREDLQRRGVCEFRVQCYNRR
jgi:hypothetical protein